MPATSFVFAVVALARFDSMERWVIIILLASSPEPVPEKVVLGRLGPIEGHVTIRRAIKRLMRDRVIDAASDRLRVSDPARWPAHRLDADDLARLEDLVRPTHDDRSAASPDGQKAVHPAVLAAKEAARRKREVSQVPAPKLHQVTEDDDDASWLDGNGMPDESQPKTATSCPLADDGDTTPTEMKCATCANALGLLASPLPGLAMWAKQHLSTCVLSPKGPGWPI
jgi:hypothetical protein